MEEQLRLRKWMILSGIGTNKLADMIGVDPSLVSYVVNGHRRVTDGFRWRFAQAFGVRLAIQLLGEGGKHDDKRTVAEDGGGT